MNNLIMFVMGHSLQSAVRHKKSESSPMICCPYYECVSVGNVITQESHL